MEIKKKNKVVKRGDKNVYCHLSCWTEQTLWPAMSVITYHQHCMPQTKSSTDKDCQGLGLNHVSWGVRRCAASLVGHRKVSTRKFGQNVWEEGLAVDLLGSLRQSPAQDQATLPVYSHGTKTQLTCLCNKLVYVRWRGFWCCGIKRASCGWMCAQPGNLTSHPRRMESSIMFPFNTM